MNKEYYDIIILGTGITESVLSVLLSKEKYKVLNIDQNSFYGGTTASLNLNQLWQKFINNQLPPQHLGNYKEWNVDLCPKLLMAQGKLIQIILQMGISNYLNWQNVQGSYVYHYKKGGLFTSEQNKLLKIPISQQEVEKSKLMNMIQKSRYKNFIHFIQNFKIQDKNTYNKLHIQNINFQTLAEEFNLSNHVVDFIGHAIALYNNNSFRVRPALEVIKKIKLYIISIGKYSKTPFIYPVYGLSSIAESLAKKSVAQGSTYILNVDIKKIEYIENKYKVTAIYEDNYITFFTDKIIANTNYLNYLNVQDQIKQTYKCIRVVCIIDHPIKGAENDGAIQIIFPSHQINRTNDIYIIVLGPQHSVCREGYFIAIISTIKESDNIDEDLKVAFNTLGSITQKFIIEEQMYNITEYKDNIFITKPQDQTSNFESSQEDMIKIYQAITEFKQRQKINYKMNKFTNLLILFFIFSNLSCENITVKQNQKLEHMNQTFNKFILCTADELQFLHKHYNNYLINSPISLLTSTEELNNMMCTYKVYTNNNYQSIQFQLTLKNTEFFNTKGPKQSCTIKFDFIQCDKESQDCDQSFAYVKDNKIKLLTFIPWSLHENDYEEKSCLKTLNRESNRDFENRLRSKIEQIKNQLNHSMNKILNESPEILATTQVADNQKLEEIIVSQALVKIITERFPAYTKRIVPFKNIISEYQPKFQWAVRKYLSENEEAIKEALRNYSGSFINKMEKQLSDQLVSVANTQAIQTLFPQMTGNVMTTVASLIISFIVRFFFDSGYEMISNIISDVVTKLYRLMMRSVNGLFKKKRVFKDCSQFKNLKMDEILANNIHDTVSFSVNQDNVVSCEAEKIDIHRITIGFEIKIEVQSPNGLCKVKVFKNQQNQINILPQDEDSYPCDTSLGVKKLIQQEQEEQRKFQFELEGQLDAALFDQDITSRDLQHISFENGYEINTQPLPEDQMFMYYV